MVHGLFGSLRTQVSYLKVERWGEEMLGLGRLNFLWKNLNYKYSKVGRESWLSLWRSLALDYGTFTPGYGSCNLFKDLFLYLPNGDHYSQFVDDCEDQSQECKEY